MKLTTVFCMIAVLMVAFVGSAQALPLPDFSNVDLSNLNLRPTDVSQDSTDSQTDVLPFGAASDAIQEQLNRVRLQRAIRDLTNSDLRNMHPVDPVQRTPVVNQNLIDYIHNRGLGDAFGLPSSDQVGPFDGIKNPVDRIKENLNLNADQLRDLFPVRDNGNTFQVPPRINPGDLTVVLSSEQLLSKYTSLNADKNRYDHVLTVVENDLNADNIDASEAAVLAGQFEAMVDKIVELQAKAESLARSAHAARENDLEGEFKELARDFASLQTRARAVVSALQDIINTIPDPEQPQDTDNDGVVNTSDNCPNTANPAQTDTDTDGVGDACDTMNNNDTDGDGIVNGSDNCPAVANGNQADADGDHIGDVCDAVNNTSTYQGRFDTLKSNFDDFENDFDDYKKKYKKAVRDDDSSDVRRFKQKLNDLKDDLDQLTEDAEEIQDDIKDDSHRRDFDSLSDDIDEFINDVEDLQDEIKEVLGETSSQTEEQRQQLTDSAPTAARRTPATVTPEPAVVVQPLDFSGVRAPVVEQPAPVSVWEQVRGMVYLGAGIAVLIAVIIFMLALIVSRKN